MKSKYAFLVVFGLAVAVAGYSYYDDLTFSTSEAGYTQVQFSHVEGTQTLTIGETVRLKWPSTYSGAKVELVAFNVPSGSLENGGVYPLGYAARNSFKWFIADDNIPGGIPRDTLLSFRVTKDGYVMYSSSFAVSDWIGDPNN